MNALVPLNVPAGLSVVQVRSAGLWDCLVDDNVGPEQLEAADPKRQPFRAAAS